MAFATLAAYNLKDCELVTRIFAKPIDYDHYVTRQLQPVADAILPFVHSDFRRLVDGQMELF